MSKAVFLFGVFIFLAVTWAETLLGIKFSRVDMVYGFAVASCNMLAGIGFGLLWGRK